MLRLTTLIILASAVVSGFTKSIAMVEDSFDEITSQVNNLIDVGTPIGTTRAATFADAMTMHGLLRVLDATVDRATRQVQSTPQPFSSADSEALVASARKLEPVIMKGLALVGSKKAFVNGVVPFPLTLFVSPLGIATDNLMAIQGSASTLTKAMVDAVHNSSKVEGMTISKRLTGSISDVVKSYKS